MPEPAERPIAPKPPHTWRPMVGWTLGILAALGLVWFVGAVAVPVRKANRAIEKCEGLQFSEKEFALQVAVEAEAVGGKEVLADYLGVALNVPPPACRSQTVAASMLAHCGKPAVPVLIKALTHRDHRVRNNAACALIEIGPDAVEAVPALIGRLGDSHGGTRRNAVAALGRIGDVRGEEPLKLLLNDKDEDIRQAAAEALKKIRGQEPPK